MVWRHFAFTLFLMFGIAVVCLLPASGLPSVSLFDGLHTDKVLHFIMFGILSLSMMVSFKKQPKPGLRRRAGFLAVLIVSIFGLLTEAMQHMMQTGRTGEWLDALANLAGALTGIVVFKFIYGKELELN